jgi:hypothetical protein
MSVFFGIVLHKLIDLGVIFHVLSAARLQRYCQAPNGFFDCSEEA